MMQIVYKLNNLTPEEIKIVEGLPVRNRTQIRKKKTLIEQKNPGQLFAVQLNPCLRAPHRQAWQDIFRHQRPAIPSGFWRIHI